MANNKVKDMGTPGFQNSTSRTSRMHFTVLKIEKDPSKEDMNLSLSPTPRGRIVCADHRMSKSLNNKKLRGELQSKPKTVNKMPVTDMLDDSMNSMEERKSYNQNEFNTCEDDNEMGQNVNDTNALNTINNTNIKKKKKGFAALSEMVPINLEKEQQFSLRMRLSIIQLSSTIYRISNSNFQNRMPNI